jgi:hypothetical protein
VTVMEEAGHGGLINQLVRLYTILVVGKDDADTGHDPRSPMELLSVMIASTNPSGRSKKQESSSQVTKPRIPCFLIVILVNTIIAGVVDKLTIIQDSQPSFKVLVFNRQCFEKLDTVGDIRYRKRVIGIALGLRK